MSRIVRRIGVLVTVAALAVAAVGVGIVLAATRWVTAPLDDTGPYVLLVIGSDDGPPRGASPLDGRADALHLLVVTEDRQHVTFVDFPRDAWVDVPGVGRTKINAALTHGPETVVATMESNWGFEVDNYILTDFQGFVVAIDELGGLEISVEERLYDPVGSSSNLYPGVQRLRGLDALSYARDRHSRSDGDFGRAAAQSRVLKAVHEQLRNENPSLERIAQLLSILRRTTISDIPPDRMLRLAMLAMAIPPQNTVQYTLPGSLGTAGSASVVYLTDRAHEILRDLADDGFVGPRPTPSPAESPSG